jgi:predicted acylesterase/phospholipase RssA
MTSDKVDAARKPAHEIGLALSGGGSRAAAFHCGIVNALEELQILDTIGVVSTVSGGSIFGAAWMVSRKNGASTAVFIDRMQSELLKGFIARSFGWRVLKMALPGYTRSHLLADTFDRIFFGGSALGDLPERPLLCINTTVLNNGQVGKFTRDGFATYGLYHVRPNSSPVGRLKRCKLSLAATSSAAFPVGLPPVMLAKSDFEEGVVFQGPLEGHTFLALSDGGVLENLGVQTLLTPNMFGAHDLVVSDAAVAEVPWRPHQFFGWAHALAISLLSASVLERVLLLMSDKGVRSSRANLFSAVEKSRMSGPEQQENPARERRLIFARVNQDWNSMLENIASLRLRELLPDANVIPSKGPQIELALKKHAGVDFHRAKLFYNELGGDAAAAAMNRVKTNFTALPKDTVHKLALHAEWQVHALHEIYWKR